MLHRNRKGLGHIKYALSRATVSAKKSSEIQRVLALVDTDSKASIARQPELAKIADDVAAAEERLRSAVALLEAIASR